MRPRRHKRFEQRVAEAQCDQVLHRLLAQIVIDAEDLLFLEDRTDQLVDGVGGGAVLPQRLLQHDTRFGRDELGAAQVLAGGCKQVRCHRQEHHADSIFAAAELLSQAVEVRRHCRVHGQVVHEGGEGLPVLIGELPSPRCGRHFSSTSLRKPSRVCWLRADRDDARAGGDLSGTDAPVQRRHEFAHGEIAGAAKQDQVEWFELLHRCRAYNADGKQNNADFGYNA